MSTPSLLDRYRGCFLGLAIGDALGSPMEGMPADMIFRFFGAYQNLCTVPSDRNLHYTDDTQMMIGVAQTLLANGQIVEEDLVARFVENLEPSRGYGPGAIRVLQAMYEGRDWKRLTETMFPGGSYGNGAAMRVAPIGLVFRDDLDRAWEEARLSALPTHVHPLGVEGAQLLAIAIAWVATSPPFDRRTLFDELLRRSKSEEFQWLLSTASELTLDDSVSILGNGIEAQRSVVTSIACFALSPKSYTETVGRAISIGGDTDTIAAMAGALSGTYLGFEGLPRGLVDQLENGKQGRDQIIALAEQLHARDSAK